MQAAFSLWNSRSLSSSREIPGPVVRAERLIYLIASSIVIGLVVGKLISYSKPKSTTLPSKSR